MRNGCGHRSWFAAHGGAPAVAVACGLAVAGGASAGPIVFGDGVPFSVSAVVVDVEGASGLLPRGGRGVVLVKALTGTFSLLEGGLSASDVGIGGEWPAGSSPQRVEVGDLDGDGDSDLVFVQPASNRVRVVWNDGDSSPRFRLGAVVVVGEGTSDAVIVDVDGDGLRDVVASNRNAHTFTVVGNLGSESFTVRSAHATTAWGPAGVAAADFTGDGVLDVAVSGSIEDRVEVHAGDGAGGFGAGVGFVTGRGPSRLWAVDVDVDGWADLVVFNEMGSSVSVLRNRGAGSGGAWLGFSSSVIGPGSGLRDVAVGDVEGDGDVDLVLAMPNGPRVWENDGAGVFAGVGGPVGFGVSRVGLADLDGDRLPEVVGSSGSAGTVWVYANESEPAVGVVCPGDATGDGAVTALDLSVVLGAFGSLVVGAESGDVTGDGVVSALDIGLVLSRFGETCGED